MTGNMLYGPSAMSIINDSAIYLEDTGLESIGDKDEMLFKVEIAAGVILVLCVCYCVFKCGKKESKG